MKKYVTRRQTIEEVEVERETEFSVWIGGRSHWKSSGYECYHDSFDLAKAFIVMLAQKDVENARLKLACAEGKLVKAQSATLLTGTDGLTADTG